MLCFSNFQTVPELCANRYRCTDPCVAFRIVIASLSGLIDSGVGLVIRVQKIVVCQTIITFGILLTYLYLDMLQRVLDIAALPCVGSA